MLTLLFARTFVLVGGMLILTAITAKMNRTFETAKEAWFSILGTLGLLVAILFLADSYPLNIILVAVFSALMGWEIGPTIEYYGKRFKLNKWLKTKGIVLAKGQTVTEAQKKEFEEVWKTDPHANEWHNIVFQAILATAIATFGAASLVFLTNWNFSFLGGFLLMALIILLIMTLLNIFIFRSKIFSMFRAYFGVILFTLYLLFDFNQLESMARDESWAAAINIAVNIYLDIINLFLHLLQILSDNN